MTLRSLPPISKSHLQSLGASLLDHPTSNAAFFQVIGEIRVSSLLACFGRYDGHTTTDFI
jgi:hypothetical protein